MLHIRTLGLTKLDYIQNFLTNWMFFSIYYQLELMPSYKKCSNKKLKYNKLIFILI